VLSAAEANKPLQYALTGLFHSSRPQIYASYSAVPAFGRAVHSTAVANPAYLLLAYGEHINVRTVAQKSGGVLFAIDQIKNPESVVLRPGGRYGDTVILCGMIGTVSHSAASTDLYNFITKVFRSLFIRKREFLVGPEAAELWKLGGRLTIGAESPEEFDLAEHA
jgi:hypothetical protein